MRKLKDVVIASVAGGIVLLATMLGAAQAPAYRAPRTADGKPNLNGIWQALNTADLGLQGHAAAKGPVPSLGAGVSVPGGVGVGGGGGHPPFSGGGREKKEITNDCGEPWREGRCVCAR